MKFFVDIKSVGEAKTLYRNLAKQYHPDLHGPEATATMQAINAEYHSFLAGLDGSATIGEDGKEHTYYYNRDIEQELMDKISALLKLRMADVEIELIGTWIWIQGDTRPHKEELKALGCSWHSKRIAWYWRRFTYRRHYSGADMDSLRQMYGSQRFESDNDKALATA